MEERTPSTPRSSVRPEDMREAVAGYVQEIHRAYVDQAATFPPAIRGGLPLVAAHDFTVAAVAAKNLHLLATVEALGPLRGPEIALEGDLGAVSWTLRFYDQVVLPELALVDETAGPAFAEVRHALGVRTILYHFVAEPGAGLSGHHAAHVGTGLAYGHSATARDFETIRSRARGREALVDEMAGAAMAGLTHAQALLARAIAPHDETVAAACGVEHPDPDELRQAVLASVGGRTRWTPAGTPSEGADR